MDPLSEEELVRYYRNLPEEHKVLLSQQIKDAESGNKKHESALRRNLTHKAIGKLFFEFEDEGLPPKPLHNMDVELWDRDITNPDDFLGSSKTGIDGGFEILYDPQDAGKRDLPDLELRIFERQHKFDSRGNVTDRQKLIYSIKGEDNVTRKVYDFGSCKIPYWEYDPGTVTPRVLITDEGEAPQSYASGRSLQMLKVMPGIEAKKKLHILMAKIISMEEIQNAYPKNKTRLMEEENPGSSRSDDFFADCLLNGMSANILDRDPSNPALFWIHYHFNSYEQDGIYALPNIDIRFRMENEKPIPVEITIGIREKGITSPNAPLTTITVKSDEGDKWDQAKRIARVSSAVIAELDMHLCTTHLNTEQYAISAYRNIRDNPVRYLLFPHIKEVALINHSANSLLLGDDGYVTRATGFTEKSLYERIRQVVGTLDWKGWKPRKKLFKEHRYATAAHMYWETVNEYVEWYFQLYDEGIRQHWREIKLFSDELVEHSVPEFMCNYLKQTLPGSIAKSSNGHPDMSWYDWNERMDISLPRPRVNNERKAVSRITESTTAGDEDIDNLKQVCAYIIHHSTFVHWWSNSRQYDEGGELRYLGLGLRYGNHGIFTTEDDDSVLPPAKDATMQLWISYMLSNSAFGFILKNEEKDIHPKFLELLKHRRKEFEKLGVNIEEIPSRTNI